MILPPCGPLPVNSPAVNQAVHLDERPRFRSGSLAGATECLSLRYNLHYIVLAGRSLPRRTSRVYREFAHNLTILTLATPDQPFPYFAGRAFSFVQRPDHVLAHAVRQLDRAAESPRLAGRIPPVGGDLGAVG